MSGLLWLSLFCLVLAIVTSVLYAKGRQESKDPTRGDSYVVRTLKTNRNFMISSWVFFLFFLYWWHTERPEQARQKQLQKRLNQIATRYQNRSVSV
jgi:uncharacterized membrane protein